jgi:Clp amino terminal domain, pathogenicity island component
MSNEELAAEVLAELGVTAELARERCAKTEHILLAASSPKLHSPAASLLADCGASPDRVRDQLTRLLLREAPELADRLRNRSLLSRVRMRNL